MKEAMLNRQNKKIEEYENGLLSNIVSCVEKNDGNKLLSSIILTGSMGRNEATYIMESDDVPILKSDVEIALVYKKKKKSVNKIIDNVVKLFDEDVNLMAIAERRVRKVCNFNFSVVVPRYKTIFTYDLYNGSKTIWGKDFISENRVELDACDIYEAKRLVANRIGELVHLQNTSDKSAVDFIRRQWKGKLVLAIASAWLICERLYESSYHQQFYKILENSSKVETCLGESFIEEYKAVFSFLRENGNDYEVPDERLVDYVACINKQFAERKINKPRVNNFCRLIKYSVKYFKTGVQYGIIGFEDNILQSLIDEFYMKKIDCISRTAEVWDRVLH